MRVLAILLAALVAACAAAVPGREAADVYLESWGLVRTTTQKAVVVSAIEQANAILNIGSSGIVLARGWEEWPAAATPVHLVESPSRGSQGPCFVLPRVNAVIVDASEVAGLADRFSYNSGATDSWGVNPVSMLTVLLLHEAGHLALDHNEHESYFLQEGGASNLLLSEQKEMELAADSFAAAGIKRAFNFGGDAFHAALNCQLALATASFNQTGRDMLTLPIQRLSDHSYTHPNIGMRVLLIMHGISGHGADLLEEYRAMRRVDGVQRPSHLSEGSVICTTGCNYLGWAGSLDAFRLIEAHHLAEFPGHKCTLVE